MADSAQDRKLPASPRKIAKARADGQVARSRDLGHFGAIAAGVALLAALAPELSDWLTRTMALGLRFDAAGLRDPQAMARQLVEMATQMMAVLLPLFGCMLAVSLASGVLCGGWNFTLKPLTPDLSKIDPLAGLLRLFSGHQLGQTLKASLLAILLGLVGAWYLQKTWEQHAELLSMPLPAALAAAAVLLRDGLLGVCALLAVFALVDVPLQRQLFMNRQRMSPEEQKREFKENEGSGEVKGLMKRRMREMANRRMFAAVPLADLVVMNPTHYAVALKYDETSMAAPRVVAKGADLIALRIRDLAREAKVPVLESPPLARALYAHAELDQEIPARLFAAVAQVLAWVYQLRDALAAGRVNPAEAPVPEVPADLDPLNAVRPRGPGPEPGGEAR
jgi:flagellar biosynthetic protein FlhB